VLTSLIENVLFAVSTSALFPLIFIIATLSSTIVPIISVLSADTSASSKRLLNVIYDCCPHQVLTCVEPV
jgi:hypothetical protein